MRYRCRKSLRGGAAAVEMAVVLPVLVSLIFGSIEFGRAMMVSNLLTSAAREGCRTGVLPNANNTEVIAAVNNQLSGGGLNTAAATITIRVNNNVANVSTAVTGDRISVTVSMPYSAVTWLPTTFFIPSSQQMQGVAVMRHE